MKNFLPKEINGWKALDKDRIFNEQTIFDYINGSGEVYLSYNFRTLLVREFKKYGQTPIVVDLFDMGSAEDAFGVFTHDYENQELGIGQGSFYLSGSLTFWKGSYFVSIWSEKETEEIKKTIFKLAELISNAIPEKGSLPELINYLPHRNLNTKNIRFFHNHYSLNYHYFLAEKNILNLGQNTKAVLGEYKFKYTRSYILIIEYKSKKEAKNAIKSFLKNYLPEAGENRIVQIENKKWISFGQIKNMIFILFDFPQKKLAEQYLNEIENKLRGV
ncbi:hypothetical protein NLC29_01135 [Candidatus Aminicenantes bacterium AH-873-B07]|nr:hypothetical protein [Candidatus Aminicenantes bacterium AH-873-B07]